MKILFPTDFSESADHAFVYALKIADKLKADVTTLHVYDGTVSTINDSSTIVSVYDSLTLETFENYKDHIPHLRSIAQECDLEHVDCRHSMVKTSDRGVVSTIVHQASELDVDYIVMGTTGASGLKEVFIGSIAAEVLENAHCPVLAIPYKAEFDGSIDKLAVATEYDDKDIETYRHAMQFAKLFGAELHVIHVDIAHTEEFTHRMDDFLKKCPDYDRVVAVVVDNTSIEHGLAEYLADNSIDIIATRVTRRNFFEELFTYSMTKKLANHLAVPVLGLHEN